MGTIFRRKVVACLTCKKLFPKQDHHRRRTADRERCERAGHDLKEEISSIWWIGYKTPDGWKYETSKSTAKIDAQRLLRDKEGAIDRGQHTGRWTFADAKKAVLLDYTVNKRRSLDVFERRITKHLEPAFKDLELADITTTVLREFQAKRQAAGASNAEINRELDAISKMFKLAIQDGKLFAKPHIPKLKEASARKGFVTDEEYTAIAEKLEPHMRNVWAFQYLTGWRSTEVLGLRWEHVGKTEIRFLGQTKADEPARPFPITTALKRVLADQRKLTAHLKAPHVFVFLKGKKMAGRPISYMGYLHAFNDARDAADVRKDLIPHDCRRTAIDRMERLGLARSTAMTMVGHKTESVYRRYAIVSGKTLDDAGVKLNAVKLPG